MYADGLQIYTSTSFHDISKTLTELNILTTDIETYFNNNYLKFNKSKTECIIFHNDRQIPPPIQHITIANETIAIKQQIITLGVTLDSTLKFDSHISKTIKSCNNSLFKIKQIKHLINKHTLKIIITSLVLSKHDHCNSKIK